MKKRLLALLLAGAMSVGLAACGNSGDEGSANTPAGGETTPVTDGTGEPSAEGKTVKVGMVCIGDENDQGYTYNFMKAVEEATAQLAEQGITVEWSYKKNILEDSGCEDANIELAEDGCDIIINNSYGFEPFMLKVAPDYPEIEFISCTNQASAVDDLDNTHNAFANIYEGRYLAGVAGGMKLQQMIDEGTITAEEAVIGYVAAFPFAEVVSGYTAFYQGAKSVCPSVTMKVKYVNSWSDAPQEAAAGLRPGRRGLRAHFPALRQHHPRHLRPGRRRVPLRLQQRHDRRGPRGQPHLLPRGLDALFRLCHLRRGQR